MSASAPLIATPAADAEPPVEALTFESLAPTAPIALPAQTVTARLFRPAGASPAPAMVILSSSAGVQRHRELYYAAELARAGIAACVVDSFGPRGVRSTVADQGLVSAFQMECDAHAALQWLRRDRGIDPSRIGILGVSKGGVASVNAALAVRRRWRGVDDVFSLHVAICPGCVAQHRDPATTGAPMFFMLAEHDDYTPAHFAVAYAARLREAGNPSVRVKVYKAHHGWESLGGVYYIANAQNFSDCPNLIEDDGRHFVPAIGRTFSEPAYRAWVRDAGLLRLGAHAGGGNPALRQRATSDLIGFLRAQGF
ncbi:MAG: alpha/beta hydrolase fold domain-containing protein [Alphaproteobacteria bacterium]|nr:alpha/beta hydrolase fold domain-containing protein [Alphaproteobacteria bacterium]